MGIETKTFSMLLDEFVTNQLRCWFAQEDVMHAVGDEAVAKAAKTAQLTNARRNQLMRAIDAYFEDESGVLAKSYDLDAEIAAGLEKAITNFAKSYSST